MANSLKTPKTPRTPGVYDNSRIYDSPSISRRPYDRKTFKSYERVHTPNIGKEPNDLDIKECKLELALRAAGEEDYLDYYRPTEGMENIGIPDSTDDYSPMIDKEGHYLRWDQDWRNHFGKDATEKRENRNYHVRTAELGREKWMEKTERCFGEIRDQYDLNKNRIVLVGEGSRGNEVEDWPVLHPVIDSFVTNPQTEREILMANALKVLVNEASKLAEERAAMEHLAKIYKMRSDAFKDFVWKHVSSKNIKEGGSQEGHNREGGNKED